LNYDGFDNFSNYFKAPEFKVGGNALEKEPCLFLELLPPKKELLFLLVFSSGRNFLICEQCTF